MPFTSGSFLFIFLPFLIIVYYFLNILKNEKLNNLYLILASLFFYSFSGLRNTLYLLLFTLIIFFAGHVIEKTKRYSVKKYNFILFVVVIILIMSYYKYSSIIFLMLKNINKSFFVFSDVVIPLGMSFIMFEAISYLVDVYKKDAKAGSLGEVILFFVFFPKITSGPIVLWKNFYNQILNRKVSVDLFFSGIEKIMIGFAKKSIIADTLGLTVDSITSNNINGIDFQSATLCTICYFLQIYFDFSGYSDIAIGISRLFGFRFEENFNLPYTSLSIGEFWRRWHISLGMWFRQYIYIPLGGNEKNIYFNLFVVFLITGIWHGSTFNFILWGLLHGILIIIERVIRNKMWYIKTPNFIKWMFTMFFVAMTWIIFMLPSLSDVIIFYKSMLGLPNGNIYLTYQYFLSVKILVIIIIAFLGATLSNLKIFEKLKEWMNSTKQGILIKFIIYFVLFVIAILFMINSSYSPFLYFQF